MTTTNEHLSDRGDVDATRDRRSESPPQRRRLESAAGFGLLFVLLAMIAGFGAARPDTYLTGGNLLSIAETQAITALLALAIVGVLTIGEFDLSFAAYFGLAQVLVVGLIVNQNLPPALACLIVVALGAALGLINTLLIVKFHMDSFIATLGVSTVLAGVTDGYSGGSIITGNLSPGFLKIGQGSIAGVGLPVLYVLGTAVALFILLQFTTTGRKLLVVGRNREAARLAGISVGAATAVAFVIAGIIAGGAAIVSGSQLGSGQPVISSSYLLPAYAGAFLGATTITPGRFNVWGTIVGVYLLGAGTTGLQQLGLQPWLQDVFDGAVLICGVGLSGYLARRTGRRSATRG